MPEAKLMSKIFKIISVLGIITCHIFKWCGKLEAPSGEICFMWAVVYGLGAGTIDFNIMLISSKNLTGSNRK